jgi:hypothetical protein
MMAMLLSTGGGIVKQRDRIGQMMMQIYALEQTALNLIKQPHSSMEMAKIHVSTLST